MAYILGNLTTIQSATHSVLAKSINDIVAAFGKVYEEYLETAKNNPAPQVFKVHIDLMIKVYIRPEIVSFSNSISYNSC